MSRIKKSILIFKGILILLVVLVILFVSPITKHLIEKYDEKYTGREITMDLAYVNPFTGFLHLKNLKILEFKSDTVFFSADGLSVNFSLLKLIKSNYEISKISLDHPWIMISQTREKSNLDDLIEKFNTPGDTNAAPVKYNVKSVNITNGELHYRDNVIPINYFIKKLNLETSAIRYDSDTVSGKIDFESGVGSGNMKADFMVNMKLKRYRLGMVISKFDITLLEQYLKDIANYGTVRAIIDADLKTSGSYIETDDITIAGRLDISDFHFGKKRGDDYASFDKLKVTMTEISPKKYIFHGDSILLEHPYFRYETYDNLDNIETMFGLNGSNITVAQADVKQFNLLIEIADFVKQISQYFFQSHYKINSLAITDADIRYNDYSLSEKFSIDMNPLTITADSIDKNHKWVYLRAKSGIKPYGNFYANVNINPKDSSDFDLEYKLEKVPVSTFNPYLITYSSFPVDRGILEFGGTWHVRNGKIDSKNNLLIIDPRLSKRLHNKDISWIPLRFVFALLREHGNVINYEIPITGDLSSPKFHIGDILDDMLQNIFIKPVKTPYSMRVNHVETEIEKTLSFKWPMRKAELLHLQEKFIKKIHEFLQDNPDVSLAVYPQIFTAKEKEYILFYEAKKKYYLALNPKLLSEYNENDSTEVEKMSVKDSTFMKYLHKNVKDSLKFTIQEKCLLYVGQSKVDQKLNELNAKRLSVFKSFFDENTINQLSFFPPKSIIPFNGFSFYRLDYKGDVPQELLNAFYKMEELNEDSPRKKFKKEREKINNSPEADPNKNKKKQF